MKDHSAAATVRRLSSVLERGLMTDSEFALTSLTCLIDEPENDPLPAILSPSESHQKLVVAAAVEFAIIEYPPGFGGSEELQREYQSHARIVRDAILAHFKP